MANADPIIEELHNIREQILNESKEKGIPLLDYINIGSAKDIKKSNLKPVVTTLKKLKTFSH